MLGKARLCALSQEDLKNVRLLNRIEDKTSSTFLALHDILRLQSNLGQLNISRKRQATKQSGISLDTEVSQSIQVSSGVSYPSSN
jgi:hypothetical protein